MARGDPRKIRGDCLAGLLARRRRYRANNLEFALRTTGRVWPQRCRSHIYFDGVDLSLEAEASHERRLRDLFQHLPIKLDVKNEARVHLWYQDRFGYAIKPYSSSADAIATFPTTATAVGIRQIRSKLECCAPFGLDDLFGLVVRPNKQQITRSIYEAKVNRWRSIWPRLTFLAWEEMTPPAQ